MRGTRHNSASLSGNSWPTTHSFFAFMRMCIYVYLCSGMYPLGIHVCVYMHVDTKGHPWVQFLGSCPHCSEAEFSQSVIGLELITYSRSAIEFRVTPRVTSLALELEHKSPHLLGRRQVYLDLFSILIEKENQLNERKPISRDSFLNPNLVYLEFLASQGWIASRCLKTKCLL